jgi:hypothetical protein
MDELKIPNPYTIPKMYSALQRFSNLHKDSGWDPIKSMRKIEVNQNKKF